MTTYEETLLKAVNENSNIIVMTAENRAFLRNVIPHIQDRFIDVGICEQNMFGIAGGLAIRGKTVITHALAMFLVFRPYEFIRTLISFPKRDVKIVGAFPGILSEANGYTHQAIEDIALMRLLPNMVVISPACSEEMGHVLKLALTLSVPVYIRFNHISSYNLGEDFLPHEAVNEKDIKKTKKVNSLLKPGLFEIKVGKYQVLREGCDLCLITHGILTRNVLIAAEILAKNGIFATVIYAAVVLPVDSETIIQMSKKNKIIVIVEDHVRSGGLNDEINDVLIKAGIIKKVIHIGISKLGFQPALLKDILLYEELDPVSISEKIEANL